MFGEAGKYMTPDKNNLNENSNIFLDLSGLADALTGIWNILCLIAEGMGSLF